ncbi:MAG TPA: tetratricopeptide repeat protein [Gemmataceae bacterium]|nr:tetratricopeptide repeat protein [Gemmataceae bacterium]
MRKLNVRFLLILLAVFTLAGSGLYLLHRFQQDRIARALLWQAEHARDEGQIERAALFYSQYLEFRPADQDTRIAFGAMLEKSLEKQAVGSRNPNSIIFLYEEALKGDPSRSDVRRRIVKLYMLPRMRRYNDAMAHLDQLQKDFPQDGEIWQLRGLCLEATAKYEEAADALRQAIRFPPEQIHSHELLARILRQRLNRNPEADAVIDAMIVQHGQSPEAHLARARYMMENKLGKYDEDVAQAIQLAPENAEAILLAARVEHEKALAEHEKVAVDQENKHIAEAVKLLEKGIQLYPDDARMYRHLAWIQYHLKQRDAARQLLQTAIEHCPDDYELHTALAELLIQGKMFDQVDKIISDLKNKGVRDDRIRYLTARIAVEQEHWVEAVGLLEKLRTEARTNADLSVQLNLLLAVCFRHLNDTDRQQESLTRALEFDAQNVLARQGLATLYASLGRLNEAIQEYQQMLNFPNPPFTALADMVRLMISRKRRDPDDKQSWEQIQQAVQALTQKLPDDVDTVLAQSDLLLARNQLPQAVNLLKAACGKAPKEVRLWLQYAHASEQNSQKGLAALDEAKAAMGDAVELRLKRAALLLNRSPADVQRGFRELEQPGEGYTAEQIRQLREGLADMYYAAHDFTNAKRLYRQLADQRPGDLLSRRNLFEIAIQEKDKVGAQQGLMEIRRIEPAGGTSLPMLEARCQLFLAEEGDASATARARSFLMGVLEQRPNWPPVHQALGQLAELEQDKVHAIESYRKAIELGDTDLRCYGQLVRLLVDSKQEKEAEKVLQQVKQGSLSPERRRQMLQLVSPLLPNDTMRQHIQASVGRESLDPHDRIWLGKMLWDTGDHAGAIAEFRKATDLGGQLPEAWTTLVQALVLEGQLDEARQQMGEARKRVPAEKAAATVAACLEIAHQYDEALTEYGKALEIKPINSDWLHRYARLLLQLGRTSKAIELFGRIIAQPGNLAKDDVAWARRNLAILGTMDRKAEGFQRGYELLAKNESELGPNLEDMRAHVVLLSHEPPGSNTNPSPRRQAIELLEKIVQSPQSVREDRFSLARLYDAEKEWDKADKQYRAVVDADPKDPAALVHYARRLLQLGKLDQASPPLARLEKLAPNDAATVTLQARQHFLRGDIERTLLYLSDYVNRAAPQSIDAANRAYTAATLLDEFTRGIQQPANQPNTQQRLKQLALQLYQSCAAQKPDAIIRMADLMSHTGEMQPALDMIDHIKPPLPLGLKASAVIAALRSGHASVARCKEFETWLKEAGKDQPLVDLELHFADLRELQHDFTGAEARYRKLLTKDPNNIVALNNLAWVLACRGPSEEALEKVHRAIAVAGPMIDLLDTRAKVYLALNRPAEAIQDLEDAIADSPTAMRYFHLALAREMSANQAGAKEAFHLAVRYGIDQRDLHPADVPSFEELKSL